MIAPLIPRVVPGNDMTKPEFEAILMHMMTEILSDYRIRSRLPLGINPVVQLLSRDQMVVDSVMEEDESRAVFYVKVTL